MRYHDQTALRLLLPEKLDAEAGEVLGKLRDRDVDDVPDLIRRIQILQRQGHAIHIYPMRKKSSSGACYWDPALTPRRRDPPPTDSHPLRRELLTTELLALSA